MTRPIEIANTPAFRQVSLTLAFFPDVVLHPNFQHFVEATEDHFQQLEALGKETEENRNG